ncbi:MAG: HlyC/CorC family transporter [Pseudomonadota bacterium]
MSEPAAEADRAAAADPSEIGADGALAAAAHALSGPEAWVWAIGVGVAFLLVLSAFFSGSETALTAASRPRLRSLADQGSRGAKVALRLTEDNERLIGSVLLGNNLVNILATSLTTSLLLALVGESGVAIATVGMTLLVLIFAEVLPKTYAITRPEAASIAVARPIALAVRLFAPVVSLVRAVVRLALALFGVKTDPEMQIHAREEIRGAIDLHHSEGAVEREARDRLLGALELDDREVAQVMIHRRSIFMIDVDDAPEAILDAALRSPYTRIPLYRNNQENIIGVIHAKDLLRAVNRLIRGPGGALQRLRELDVASIAMKPWFVPDTTSLADQLRAFLARKSHFALVVDEYGALQGLVTLEDILEEIVGEIADEHDDEVEGVAREGEDAYVVDGATAIRDLNRKYDWSLPEDEATTIAGLVIHEAQTIPTRGQIFIFHGFRFEILERERHQITKLRMRQLEREEEDA